MRIVSVQRRALGFTLIVFGLLVLGLGASATIGLVDERFTRPVATQADAPMPAAAPVSRAVVDIDALGLDVERSVETPLDASDLPPAARAALPPAVTLPGVGRVAVGLESAAAPRVDDSATSVKTLETGGVQLVGPVAQGVALGAAAFAGAGLVAYFWTSVKTWAARLLVVPLVPLYAKITRAQMFENHVRERIFGAIKAAPGVSASDLARIAGVAWGTTIYHLDVLQQNRMVTSLRNGRHRRYFENGAALGADKQVLALLQNPVTAHVVRTVRASPGLTQKALAEASGMSPQALHWHVQRLVAANVVQKQRDGRVVRHFAA